MNGVRRVSQPLGRPRLGRPVRRPGVAAGLRLLLPVLLAFALLRPAATSGRQALPAQAGLLLTALWALGAPLLGRRLGARAGAWLRTGDLLALFTLLRVQIPAAHLFPWTLLILPPLLILLPEGPALLLAAGGGLLWTLPFLLGLDPLDGPLLLYPLLGLAIGLFGGVLRRQGSDAAAGPDRALERAVPILRHLLHLDPRRSVLEAGAEAALGLFGSDWAAVFCWQRQEPDRWRLAYRTADGLQGKEEGVLLHRQRRQELDRGRLPVGRLGRRDLKAWLPYLPPALRRSRQQILRMAWAPTNGEGYVGVWLGFEGAAPTEDGEEGASLELLAGALALLLQSRRSERAERKRLLNAVEGLVRAVEAKHPYTRGHSDRVAFYALGIGRKMNLPPQELERLRQSALLHDVGKLAIPDAILDKPGRLDEAEYDLIRHHPLRGMRILEALDPEGQFMDVVVYHHERWDGRGYPRGLRGKEIPLLARIVAVADVFDALTSNRPYRKPLTLEEALERMEREAAVSFDPFVVSALRAFLEETGLLRVATLEEAPPPIREQLLQIARHPVYDDAPFL